MGGAGLITGIGAYLKSRQPGCQMIGCSPANSPVMIQSLRAGRLLDLPSRETLSDGTAGGVEPGSITFELCQQLVDQCVTVSETEIRDNLVRFIEVQGMLIEGAAAVAIAGLMKTSHPLRGKNIVVVLCGANIGINRLEQVFHAHRVAAPNVEPSRENPSLGSPEVNWLEHRQLKTFSILVMQHLVCVLVVVEPFLFRIPIQSGFRRQRNIRQVRKRG